MSAMIMIVRIYNSILVFRTLNVPDAMVQCAISLEIAGHCMGPLPTKLFLCECCFVQLIQVSRSSVIECYFPS